MIQNDPGRNTDCKQVDMDNLFRVVQYCENVTECRRVQLLHYFGEMDYDPSQCRSRADSMCDTCASSDSFVYKDITSEAKAFVENVNSIVHNGNRNWRKPVRSFTLNHFVDIFKVQFMFFRKLIPTCKMHWLSCLNSLEVRGCGTRGIQFCYDQSQWSFDSLQIKLPLFANSSRGRFESENNNNNNKTFQNISRSSKRCKAHQQPTKPLTYYCCCL